MQFMYCFLVLALVFTMLPTAAFAAEATEDEHIHTEECVHEEALETASEEITEESSGEDTPEEPSGEETVGETPGEEPADCNSGMIGESNVAWTFDPSTGMLKITGNGGCDTFTSAEDQPWKHLRGQIKEVWFWDMDTLAIENIAFWFEGCTALTSAELPYTTLIIGESAFANCTALTRLMMYYTETPPVIADGAFYVDELMILEVLYIPTAEDANDAVHTHDWNNENRAVYYGDIYGISALATGTCSCCKVTCSYTLDYEQWTENVHCIRHWCSNCGLDQCGGVNAGDHVYNSRGTCTYCGYYNSAYDNSAVCYHTSTYYSWSGCTYYIYCRNCGAYMGSGISHGSTYTEWSGCNWYEYCRDCDQLMDYGTSHGSYSYGAWEYYNSSQHRRLYSCNDCGQGSYSYGYHSTSTKYTSYSSTQHQKGSYCSTCGSYVGSTSYESHSFSYGSWSNYSSTQHRRTKTCSTCGYSTYEYASHSLTNGSWTSTGSSQHKRTMSCSCGYSTTEYANHSLTYGSWKSYSDSQHRRTVSCSTCGYSTYEYASHSMTNGSWTSVSDSQHSRTNTCTCGYSKTETASHSFTYGEWKSVSEEAHSCTKTCSCGYSGTETEAHDLTYGDWSPYDEEQHKRVNFCDCGYSADEYGDHADTDDDDYCDSCDYLMSRFSVTVPATLNLTVAKDGTVYAATTAQIVNNSTDAVSVTSIQLNTENGWQLVPYSTNMANAKVDARLIGFSLNGAESDGTENLPMSQDWQIAKNDALTLDYDAVVSATSDPINEQVLTIVFVLDWAK